MVTDPAKFEAFRENHAALAFHVAAMMQAALRLREAEHMVAQGQLGNAAGLKTEYNYHRSKVRALVQTM